MEVHTHFTALDWGVLVGYLLLTTWVGHRLRGQQANIKDFFLAAARSMAAVCGSIIATEISAVTFIGVPGAVFAVTGTSLTCNGRSARSSRASSSASISCAFSTSAISTARTITWRIGSAGREGLTTALFMIGSILGQSVRVLVPAMVLRTVTPLSMTRASS
jgi:SSS family solute:Na+ symporter